MHWYYAVGGTQFGPVDEVAFDKLVASGAIQPATLVWHEGMAAWRAYSELAPPVPPEMAATGAAGMRFCTECGVRHPASEMLQFGNSWVCANCKDIFTQKLREGVSLGAARHYGGFWIRFGARTIDWIILWVVSMAINFAVLGNVLRPSSLYGGPRAVAFLGFTTAGQIAIAATYETYFLVRFGATPGKLALGLKVITAGGGPISPGLGVGRYFAHWVSGAILAIGYLMAAFDDEKRALHDRICNTRVIKK